MNNQLKIIFRYSYYFKSLFAKLKRHLRLYGLSTTLRLIFYIHYYLFKQLIFKAKKSKVKVNGYEILVNPEDKGISTELLMFKTHEPLTTKVISQNLKRGMTCLDIGSNIGYYVLLERKIVGKKGKIIAIEASPSNFGFLKKNIKSFKSDNIKSYNFAVSDKNCKVDFLVDEHSNLSRVVDKNSRISSKNRIIKVPAQTIDKFLAEKKLGKIDFVRMDVEGHGPQVLRGMRQTIKKFKPYLNIEMHRGYLGYQKTKKFLKQLKKDGYELQSYIPRIFDFPTMGSDRDIQNKSLDNLLEKLEKDLLPETFHLFLVHPHRGLKK